MRRAPQGARRHPRGAVPRPGRSPNPTARARNPRLPGAPTCRMRATAQAARLGFGRAGGQTRARGGGVGQGRFAETHPAGPSERSPATRKTPGSARRAPQTGSIARQRHPPSTQGTPESLQPKPKGGGGLRQSATLGHSPRLPGGPFERRPCPVAPGAPAALPPSLQRARRLTGVTPRGPPAGKRGSGFTARGPETRG